jgi:putative chitinase
MDLTKLSVPPSVKAELPSVMKTFGIDTPLRLAHFLGQAAHESMNFRVVMENLNYSAQGLLRVFPKYFTWQEAQKYQRKPQEIANRVYANRMGNGPESSGDGWKYRGRGYFQLTGKNNYAAFDSIVQDDIVENPDYIAAKYPLLTAAWFWNKNQLNSVADRDNYVGVTKKINGGTHGLAERIALTNKFKSELGI